VRQIGRDRIGGLGDRAEAFAKLRAHEALDFRHAFDIDPRRDVDQHQG